MKLRINARNLSEMLMQLTDLSCPLPSCQSAQYVPPVLHSNSHLYFLASKVTRGEVEEWPGKLCTNAATTTDSLVPRLLRPMG